MAERSWRALIADDEPLARENLRLLLATRGQWTVAGEVGSGPAVLERCADDPPDVLFLDIRMPGLDGVATARVLDRMVQAPLVVFVTASSHHAVEAFEVAAVDYLVKPLANARFDRALDRLEELLSIRQGAPDQRPPTGPPSATPSAPLPTLVVRSLSRTRLVPSTEVVWASSEGNYVRLYLAGGQCLLHRCTLATLEQELGSDQFLRVHRGALINRSFVAEVRTPRSGPTLVVLRDGAEVEVSQRLNAAVLERLGMRPSPREAR